MNPPSSDSDDENELDRSLERGLRRPALSDEALERVRANLYAEFRSTAGATRRRRNRWIGAMAAVVSVVVVGVFFLLSGHWMRDTVVAQLVSASGSGVLNAEGVGQPQVQAGEVLHPLGHWTSRGLALARLPSGGTVRMAEGTVVQGVDSHSLALTAGKAYFDFPPGAERFVLHTTIGTIEHVGTQFEVMQSENGVRVRVREGNVVWHGDRSVVEIAMGTEVRVDREGRVERGIYPTYGDDWAWIEAITPSYEIENRKLIEFLTWVARETGRRLTFVDSRARVVADRTILHGGSVQGLRPMDALDQVLSTTSLRFEVLGGEIRIASRNPEQRSGARAPRSSPSPSSVLAGRSLQAVSAPGAL